MLALLQEVRWSARKSFFLVYLDREKEEGKENSSALFILG